MNAEGKRYSIFFKLVAVSLLVIIITVAIIMLLNFYNFSDKYKQEIEAENNNILQRVCDYTEKAVLNSLEDLKTRTLSHEMDSCFYYLYENDFNDNLLIVDQTYRFLKELTEDNSVIENIHVYYIRNQIIISSEWGMNILDEEMNSKIKGKEWIKDIFYRYNQFHIANSGNFISFKITPDLVTMYFCYSYSYPEITPQGFIAVDINRQVFEDIVHDYSRNGSMVMLDSDNNIVANEQNMQMDFKCQNLDYNELLKNDNISSITERYNGIDYIISYKKLAFENWKVVRIDPADIYYEPWYKLSRDSFLVSFGLILTSCTVLFLAMSKVYAPIRITMDKIKNSLSERLRTNNEYVLINSSFEELTTKVHDLELSLEKNYPIIKNNFVYGILHNIFLTVDQVSKQISLLRIPETLHDFTVIYIGFSTNRNIYLKPELLSYIRFEIISRIEEQNSEEETFISTILPGDHIAVIHAYGSENQSNDINYIQILDNLCQYFIRKFDIILTISVGSIENDWINLNHSYKNAQTAIKYSFLYPERKIFEYETLKERENNPERIQTIMDGFEKSMESMDIDEIQSFLDYMAQTIFEDNFTVECVFHLLENVTDFLLSYLKKVNIDVDDHGIMQHGIEKLRKASNIYWFQNCLKDIIRAAYDILNERQKNKNIEMVHKIQQYIKENLSEDLSLASVSNKTYISLSYLSKIFKKKTGRNFNRYVRDQRMNESKKLLLNTDLSINEIAKKVGYDNASYFIKTFKQAHGVTPNAIRNNSVCTNDKQAHNL